MEEKIKQIAEIVSELKYYEWNKIKTAIDKKYSSAQARVNIEANTDEIVKAIKLEL